MNDVVYRVAVGLPGFLLAIVFHEWAHARVAYYFGDSTAKMSGRLTFNPGAHYDLLGTIICPMFGFLIGGVPFGWAKPVPIDPRRFKNMRSGVFWVSFAGPLANLILGLVSAFLVALLITKVPTSFSLHAPFVAMLQTSVYINILLALFNLIPFPPLDGSKMVSTFMNYEQARRYEELQRFTLIFIIVLVTTPIFSYVLNPAYTAGDVLIGLLIYILG